LSDVRVGLGLDVHPSDPDRPLYLGGVRFEGEPGLAGHSDGDVVSHAVADALLGAAGLGDIGEHFPDKDPAYRGIAGPEVLKRVVAMLANAGFAPGRCDLTVVAERPPIAPRRKQITATLASALGLPDGAVSVKATRPEGLGLAGDGAGCMALVTVVPADQAEGVPDPDSGHGGEQALQ
jgi:2-C-methyl-D-erythritol 2,4-cyclodiphosphate synthase